MMKLDEFMRDTPREQWPKFLAEAAQRAQEKGMTVRQVLDADREALRKVDLPYDIDDLPD